MSQLKVDEIVDSSGGSAASINGLTPTESNMSGRNRIINGCMRIDQRNAGAAVTVDERYPVDRFFARNSTDGAYSAQRSTTAPSNFVNSLAWTTTTADASLGSTQYAGIFQRIEGLNISDFGWGTASALAVTLSFKVRSSLTGTFGGAIRNSDASRSYPFTYSISSADTWETKSITIPGDTSGTWLTTNGIGLEISFGLGVGSTLSGTAGAWAGANYLSATGATSVIGTLNATWYITGVQLEVGSVATPFERRPYGTELSLCQRYYQKSFNQDVVPGTATSVGGMNVVSWGDGNASGFSWQTLMRANPTVTFWPINSTTSGKVNSGGTERVASANNPSQRGFNFIEVTSGAANTYTSLQYTASAEL